MKPKLLHYDCQFECPECGHIIYPDFDEVMDGGCHCIHCEKDFEIENDNQ